jgi:hypothetical protein
MGDDIGADPVISSNHSLSCAQPSANAGQTMRIRDNRLPMLSNLANGVTYRYQGISSGGAPFTQTFNPCIAANAVNTAPTVTTTADGTASAVNVSMTGILQ